MFLLVEYVMTLSYYKFNKTTTVGYIASFNNVGSVTNQER